jgi:hypothetical protein
MALLSIPISNPNELNTYRNEAVWNHSAGTIAFNNTTGLESISLAHRGGASLVFGNQVTSEFNPNNKQVFTQGDNFATVQGSNFTLTYTNREDRTFGDHHFITGSPQFLHNILASRYIEVQAEIAAVQSIPENGLPGTGNNSNIELAGNPGDVQALLKEKEAELTQIAQSMGEGGNLNFLSCKHINIVAGTSPVNFDSGNFQKAVREVKGGSSYTGIGFAGIVTSEPAFAPQFNEVNTASTIPFGDVTVNAATKINLQAGAGGIDIKSAGSMKFAGTGMTVVGGSQVMVTSPGSVYVTSKYTELKSDGNVNIVAPQANIDSKLTVEQDAVMKGKLAVAGDSTVLGNSYVRAGIAAGAGIVAGGSMIAAGNMQAGGIISTPTGNSNNWTDVYTVVQANSATWDGGGGPSPFPQYDEALAIFSAQSANNISVYSTVQSNSGSWMPENNAAVNTVVTSNSASWSNSYTNVNANSANWSNSYTTVAANSANWTDAYTYVIALSTKVDDTLYTHYNSTKYSLQDFISIEWYIGLVEKSATIKLANGRIYMLCTGDGSSINHYLEINLKPLTPFFTSGVSDYGTIDTYYLSSYKAGKYTIEVLDTALNKIHYSEINVVSDSVDSVASEYGILYTASIPMVEYGAITNGITVSLTAVSLLGSMSSKQFKGIRTNFFN